MNFGDINKTKAIGVSAVALTLLLSTAAMAQNATVGGDDSLLPPEVVPLDPATANSMSATQAARPAVTGASSVATDGQQVPGLVSNGVPGGLQTAKDARAAAFNQLYGQGQLPQQQPFAAGGVMQQQTPGLDPQGAMNGSGSGAYGQNVAAQPPMQASTQRLSGPTKNQPKIRDTRRGGLSNGISAVSAFGTGALLSGALMRNSNPMMGLGIFGATMTGFGVRNAFRF